MKIQNSTDFPTYFLRRMVSWCCGEIGLPVRWVHHGTFRRTKNGRPYSGLGGRHRFTCRIGPDSAFPSRQWKRGGVTVPSFANRIDALVELTLHELQHLNQSYQIHRGHERSFSNVETDAQYAAFHGFQNFLKNRNALLATWNFPAPPKRTKQEVPIIDRRAAKAEADLARWTRKLKLAQTKICKLKARMRYYEKKQAAISSSALATAQPKE